MATVFLAVDLKHQRSVAIKVLHPELATSLGVERFQREDVRVGQPGRGGDLTQEALDAEARGELGMEHLDRNRSLVLQVDRQKNRCHTAAAHRAVDGVAIREAGFQTSEEGGQAALLRLRLRDSAASATLFAAWRLTASFTMTVPTPWPSRSFASAATAESPLTRATGTPCTPARAALSPSSPTGFPFSRTS